MADEFNQYLCNVGNNLACNLQHTNINFKHFLPPSIANSFFCDNITYSEIHNVINKLKLKSSSGPDVFNAKLISDIEPAIVTPLCYIYNLSLQTGSFPSALKIAKVIPIYKKGDQLNVGNYRPISLLSIFSKILFYH